MEPINPQQPTPNIPGPEPNQAPPAQQPSPIAQQFGPSPVAPAVAETQSSAAIALPSVWPGAFKIYKLSKQIVRLNLVGIVGWSLLLGVLSFVLASVLKSNHQEVVSQLLQYILNGLSAAIVTVLYLAGLRQQKVGFGDALKKGMKYWLNIFFLNVLMAITYIVSLALFIVPFFFVFPRLLLANYFLVDKEMNFIDAYKASWGATKGHVGKVYGIVGATIAMALLAITIIGIPFAIYFLIMYSAASVVLYGFILTQDNVPQAPQISPLPSGPIS